MKTIKLILITAIASLPILFMNSCSSSNEKDANPLADSLSGANFVLNSELSEKEQALQEFVNSFNEIQENLNAIKEKEKIVSKNSQSGDVKSKEETIQEDIQAIYDLLSKNKNRISSLTKKLKESKTQISGLEVLIANLQAQVDAKDGEIATLKAELESKNIELSNIQLNLQSTEAESQTKTVKLNSAYYAFGTTKELKEKGVISKEGGFIGIGKSTHLKADFNKDYFTKIDISATSYINIGAKKIKILSTHPTNSYKLVGDKSVEKIEILNPEEFWSISKYLVISTEQ
ncbi:MAG: hypothetical protein ACK504_02565 [Bacteroidota bacterium]